MPYHIAIFGGGSAGWMTASSLKAELGDFVKVSLIEPDGGARIGVGEATIPTIHNTLARLQFSEVDFLRSVDGTIKQSIQFVNWNAREGYYYHPFHRPIEQKYQSVTNWLVNGCDNRFVDYVTSQGLACDKNLSPFKSTNGKLKKVYPYAYHMNAELFADTLKSRWVEKGVNLITGLIQEVIRADNGDIELVKLDNDREVSADLYIDCTGFKRLLAKRDNEFVSFIDKLPCDRALASRPAYKENEVNLPPYTRATALKNGWVWDIPLYSRRGVGYVFSSQHTTPDKAYKELSQYLGFDVEVTEIPFYSGVLSSPWDGNCVSIGLSVGFLEPLESTGLYFAEEGIDLLLEYFPFSKESIKNLSEAYNKHIKNRFYECLDFVALHYFLSDRKDSQFWLDMKSDLVISEDLRSRIELWRGSPPSVSDFTNKRQLFSHIAYEFVLYGMNWKPDHYASYLEDRYGGVRLQANPTQSLDKNMVLHRSLLDKIHKDKN